MREGRQAHTQQDQQQTCAQDFGKAQAVAQAPQKQNRHQGAAHVGDEHGGDVAGLELPQLLVKGVEWAGQCRAHGAAD